MLRRKSQSKTACIVSALYTHIVDVL